MTHIYKKTEIGTKIRVNGSIETLVKVQIPYGLFKGESGYNVVRNLNSIKDSEIIEGVKFDN